MPERNFVIGVVLPAVHLPNDGSRQDAILPGFADETTETRTVFGGNDFAETPV